MGGSQTDTSTSQQVSSDPNVTSTVDQLLKGVSAAQTAGPQVFNQSLYSPAGATTQAGQTAALAAANNPTYSNDVNAATKYAGQLIGTGGLTAPETSALNTNTSVGTKYGQLASGATAPSLTESTLMGVAQGKDFGTNDPGYAALRTKDANDTQAALNAQFNNSGRLGGGLATQATAAGISNTLSNLDYTNYQNDIARQQQALSAIEGTRQQGVLNQNTDLQGQLGTATSGFNMGQTGVTNVNAAGAALPSLYQAAQAPAATIGAVGAAQDANTQAKLLGQNDLFQRNANAKTDLLAKLSSILAGTSPSAGSTTTTTSPSTPWYQSVLGAAGSLL